MVWTAGAALAALSACARGDEPPNALQGVTTNAQTGVTTTPQGLQINSASAASDCLSPSDMQRQVSEFTLAQRQQVVTCMNTRMAAQINAQLPRQLDELTRLDRIDAEGTVLTYNYTVLRSVAQLPANAVQQLDAGTRQMVCSQPPMRQALQLGGSYAYRWVDNRGAPIHQMRIDACAGPGGALAR